MVIVRIFEGLGNQLFQYAAARSLALRHRTGLALETTFYDALPPQETEHRFFQLDRFQIRGRPARPREAVAVRRALSEDAGERAQARLPGLRRARLHPLWEQGHGFNPDFLDARRDTVMVGYWQSERYFRDYAPAIRTELQPRAAADEVTAELIRRVDRPGSVSVHVRRGDYVTSPQALESLGLLPREYYRAAFAAIEERVSDPLYHVFSDDPAGAAELLDFRPGLVFLDHASAPEQAIDDLRVMSRCAHHIIANSTFGWWGAWLDPRPETIVIGPRRWFVGAASDADILPERWLRV